MADSNRVVYGDVTVKNIEVKAAKDAPAEKLVEIAKTIWREVSLSGVAPADDDGNDRLLTELREKHPDFAVSFPLPLKCMVQMREFEPKAFETYLKTHVKAMYKDRKEFLASQAEYFILLYRAQRPRAGAREVARRREAVLASLEKDDEEFAQAREEAAAEVKRRDAEIDKERRERIYAYLIAQRAGDA